MHVPALLSHGPNLSLQNIPRSQLIYFDSFEFHRLHAVDDTTAEHCEYTLRNYVKMSIIIKART